MKKELSPATIGAVIVVVGLVIVAVGWKVLGGGKSNVSPASQMQMMKNMKTPNAP